MRGIFWGYIGMMEKKMETTILGYRWYRIQGMWGSYYHVLKTIVYLLKGD